MRFLLLFVAGTVFAERVPWEASKIHGTPEPTPLFQLESAFPQLNFTNPVELTWAPEFKRFMLVELGTKVHLFANDPKATDTTVLLDLKAAKPEATRVYSFTLHPQFVKNRRAYMVYNYQIDEDKRGGTRVSELQITRELKADLSTEREIITWVGGGHNGCSLRFGPDGMLYISTGDATAPSPPDGLKTGQDISDLLGGILRIDVDARDKGRAYRIPPDNPFFKTPGARGEVWAYGMRNPWRMSFDRMKGDLWVGDVGWESMEMIYKVQRGGNYGWSIMEGSQSVNPDGQRGPTPILAPTVEHPHTEALSITGGYVYHGRKHPLLAGKYVYGDYVTGKIWGLGYDKQINWHRELLDTPLRIICFGTDADGELLVVDYSGGIYRLESNEAGGRQTQFPQRLSETGLFTDTRTLQPNPGVQPYTIRAHAWADGTTSTRVVAVPGEESIDLFERNDPYRGYLKNHFRLPDGSVLAKTVSISIQGQPQRLETQVLHRHHDEWHAYNYIWNDAQTDAQLAPNEGRNRVLDLGSRKLTWRHASRAECTQCHNNRSANLLAFNPPQLNLDGQLDALVKDGWFKQALPKHPPIADPYNPKADLDRRARTYLQLNCTHCHRRGGGGTAVFETRLELDLAKTQLVNHPPTQGTLGIQGAMVIRSGDPHRSTLYHRMARLGPGRMPRIGSNAVDVRGLQLMREWITAMPASGLEPVATAQTDTLKAFQSGKISALNTLMAKPEHAAFLADALENEDPEQLNIRAARSFATKTTDPNIRDLFRRYNPQQTDERLGATPDPAAILALTGQVARGKQVFFRNTTLCATCHQVKGEGRVFGPDLTRIGTRATRAQLLDHILHPSKVIHPEFQLRKAGNHVGLIVRRNDRELILRDAAGQQHTLPAKTNTQVLPASAMPPGLLATLTTQQAADLLAYLRSLK